MRNFQRLMKEGAWAQGMIAPGPDLTTPPAHAALLCGCKSVEHGIYSFEEPVIERGASHPWKKRMGFDARRLQAEPLWVSFLKAGKKVALLHFPLSFPVEPYAQEARFGADFSDRLTVIESFSQRLGFEFVRKDLAGEGIFQVKLSDQSKLFLPVRAPEKMDTLIFPEKTAGLTRFRFSAELPGDPDLYFGTALHKIFSNQSGLAQSYLDRVGPFPGGGASYSYWQGKLGKRIHQGGSGKAEQRLMATLELVGNHMSEAIRFVEDQVRPGVGFYYFHLIDLALHLWMGLLDPESPGFSPEIREFLLPMVRRTFEFADQVVGLLLDGCEGDDLLAVVSDHGMAPIERIFYPNQVLADAGLLSWDRKKGEPILERSSAVYHQSNSGYIVINSRERGGPVRGEDAEELKQKVSDLFGEYLGSVLEKVESVAEHPEIPGLGEFYLTPKYKTALSHKVEGKVLEPGPYGGQHHFWPESEWMPAILFLRGPGIPGSAKLGKRSHLEFARTVSALAGIPGPEKSRMGPIRFQEE